MNNLKTFEQYNDVIVSDPVRTIKSGNKEKTYGVIHGSLFNYYEPVLYRYNNLKDVIRSKFDRVCLGFVQSKATQLTSRTYKRKREILEEIGANNINDLMRKKLKIINNELVIVEPK